MLQAVTRYTSRSRKAHRGLRSTRKPWKPVARPAKSWLLGHLPRLLGDTSHYSPPITRRRSADFSLTCRAARTTPSIIQYLYLYLHLLNSSHLSIDSIVCHLPGSNIIHLSLSRFSLPVSSLYRTVPAFCVLSTRFCHHLPLRSLSGRRRHRRLSCEASKHRHLIIDTIPAVDRSGVLIRAGSETKVRDTDSPRNLHRVPPSRVFTPPASDHQPSLHWNLATHSVRKSASSGNPVSA